MLIMSKKQVDHMIELWQVGECEIQSECEKDRNGKIRFVKEYNKVSVVKSELLN